MHLKALTVLPGIRLPWLLIAESGRHVLMMIIIIVHINAGYD